MTYIVNQNCIKCKLMDCVDVCPVDCFYEGKNMLVIKPDECIDCGVCEPECPVGAITADTETYGLSFFQVSDLRWLDSFSVGIFTTTHEYDWLTPVEDIASPFILGLVINDKILGDAINETLRKFPQRDSWRLNQLNVSVNKAVSLYGPVKAFADADFVYLHHSNYRSINYEPRYNIKFRSGLRFERRSLLIEVYGNYYHHNLIGFEPITFNQRTEHRFDEPYGNLGCRVEFRF